jgi:hypothetical protein
MYSDLNCHNVAKYTEFIRNSYGSICFSLVMQGVSKRVVQWHSKC